MHNAVELYEIPQSKEIYMFVGWRQWADAGAISSRLPKYLAKRANATKIGHIKPDGFYLFQIPGTHDLVRPVIRMEDGFPDSLETNENEFFYAGDEERGFVYFLGDEPHLDVERYTAAILEVARTLKVRRIIGFGGVYGELPYNKDRMVSSIYSLPELKDELEPLSVTFSNYHGGASIGSYLCKFAGEAEMEYVSFYAFAPTYSFDSDDHGTNAIRVENDFVAWLNIMQRVDYMLKLGYDLTDLEKRAQKLIDTIDAKVEELDAAAPHLGIKAYMDQLAEGYEEKPFNPLDDVWADELRRLTAKFEDEGD